MRRKILTFIFVVAVATMLVSCGKKQEEITKRFYLPMAIDFDLRHSHTSTGGGNGLTGSMWGANNKGGYINKWLWYVCSSKDYYSSTSPRVNYVEILPKP